MDIKQLQSMGAFVSRKLIAKTITFKRPELSPPETWADPDSPEFTGLFIDESMTVHLRKMASADAIDIARAEDREKPFVTIWRSVCNEDGSPMFESIEQAEQLQTWLAIPLFEAIKGVADGAPKAMTTSSGTSLRSGSAGARSKSGKKL